MICSPSLHKLLWIAPELLRDETSRGSQKGDVYSFAIVVYEMFRRSETGNPYGELITLDKVIDLVKYPNGTKITRPDMKILSDPNLPVDVPDYVKGKKLKSEKLKFIYSEKATKFCKIFTLLLSVYLYCGQK